MECDEKMKTLYNDCPDPVKDNFRKNFGVKGNFQFFEEAKTQINRHTNTRGRGGSMKTLRQMAALFGDMHDPVCKAQAEKKAQACWKKGIPFIEFDDDLDEYKYMFDESYMDENHQEIDEHSKKRSNQTNYWEEEASKARATRAYAKVNEVKVASVTKEMLDASGGIEHWSNVMLVENAGTGGPPKPKSQGGSESEC